MNIRTITISTATLALVALAGCKKPEPAPSSTETTGAGTSTTMEPSRAATEEQGKTAGQAAALSEDDKEFMKKAALGGMMEVKLGSEAAQKAASPDVKAFGNRMVTDHGKANDELKQLAAKKGVTLPTTLNDDKKEKVDELSKLSGKKFDEKYAEDMVEDHEEDVKEFREASKDVKDPDLRAWAAKTVPILESHLEQAKSVKSKVKK